jgi:hypothetical protein
VRIADCADPPVSHIGLGEAHQFAGLQAGRVEDEVRTLIRKVLEFGLSVELAIEVGQVASMGSEVGKASERSWKVDCPPGLVPNWIDKQSLAISGSAS